MPAGLPRPSERRINGARSLSAGPARQRPLLPLLTTLRFFADFFLYFGFVVLVSVSVFRQIETPMRKWIAGRDRECSHRVAVATVAG